MENEIINIIKELEQRKIVPTQKTIAKRLNLKPNNLNYHLNKLLFKGLLFSAYIITGKRGHPKKIYYTKN